ncbi:TcdA/TcdB catalytic glycosyltransferase domain-containing protein [Flavobacterium sp. CAU 1735]|uniref:TcdA/TcdB catalytic glycosyltransferase domain-containing protein n=1 Tax=Flavobacterium sp. CAU 1735 TaxID=3140361 RepID=UPI00325FE8AE
MPQLPEPVITWDNLLAQILNNVADPALRNELEEYCNVTFATLRSHLNDYHELPDPQRIGEEGFRLLIILKNDMSFLQDLSFEYVRQLLHNTPEEIITFSNTMLSTDSIIVRNVVYVGTLDSELEDVFHFVNVSPSFTEYDMANIETWLIAQSRKGTPSTVNLWTDKNNVLVNDLYVEIHRIAIRRVMDRWRALYPERIATLEQLNATQDQIVALNEVYRQNPTLEILQQLRNLVGQAMQLRATAAAFLEEFKALVPSEGIPLQDTAYNFIKDQPHEQWDNFRVRFMNDQLHVPQDRIQAYIQKINDRQELLDRIQDEFPRKYPHFASKDVEDILSENPDLERYYNREVLMRMDYRAAQSVLTLLVLKSEGGNVLETGCLPKYNNSVTNILELHTTNSVLLPGMEEAVRVSSCDNKEQVENAIKERIIERKILQKEHPADVSYLDASLGDQQKINAIWDAVKELEPVGFFKTIQHNYVFKDYVKRTRGTELIEQYKRSRVIISAKENSAGLQAVIAYLVKSSKIVEQILPHLSVNMTLQSLRTFRDEVFSEEFYGGLDTDARNYKNFTIEAQTHYRLNRFLDSVDVDNDVLCGVGLIDFARDNFFKAQYGNFFSNLELIEPVGMFPTYVSYFVNEPEFADLYTHFDYAPSPTMDEELENVYFRNLQRVLKFKDYFETKAIRFYELAHNFQPRNIQFLPQELLLPIEESEGLCLGLSVIQGLADDLNATDVFASDIAALSGLQLNKMDNVLSASDLGLYNQFLGKLKALNIAVNKELFKVKKSIFKETATAPVERLSDAINKLTFTKNERFLLATPNHGMTLSRKGDWYTFYDSNIGYVSFDNLQKAGSFIQQHLDLISGLGGYYGLANNQVYITRYSNSDLSTFGGLSYFTDIINQGGISLTSDKLRSLDRKNGVVKFNETGFRRTELVEMGGMYNWAPLDENTPFSDKDFWDKMSFDAQKLYRFMYNNEVDTATINRLKILKTAGKLPTDNGVLLLSDLTNGKATGHVETLHYNILQSSEQVADIYGQFSVKLDGLLNNMEINPEMYKFKSGAVEKLEGQKYGLTLINKETGKEVAIVMDCADLEKTISNHVYTLAEGAEPALVLGGAGLGLMGLIRGAVALRGGYGSSYDIAAVALGGKQLADAMLGTIAMFIIGDTLAQSGTIFTFSIEGTLANLCEKTALKIGGDIGKLLTSISVFLKLPLIGLNIWGLYEDVIYLNKAGSGPERAVAISQLVVDSMVAALTLASFAVPEAAIPVLIVSAVGLGVTAIVHNLANAHERYYQFVKWQDIMRSLADPVPHKSPDGIIDLSRNQILGDVVLVLTDDDKNPYRLTYTKSNDTALHYGHWPNETPEQVKKRVDYGYPSTAPIPPFAREEFFDPNNQPLAIGKGIINTVVLGFGIRYKLMSQVEYISDWLGYDDRNQRASGGYWETFCEESGTNPIEQDGASCTVTGNSENNLFMTPNIVDWSDVTKATETIQKYAAYQFTITTGPGNNIVALGQSGTYKLVGGSGDNVLDLSHIELDIKVDLDIVGYQNIYNDHAGGKYENCIKASITNFNIVKCPAFINYNVYRLAAIKGATNKPNVFFLGRSTFVQVVGRGGGNMYIVSQIGKRELQYSQQIILHVEPVSVKKEELTVSVERIHFEDYKLLDFDNCKFTLNKTTELVPVLTLEGFLLQEIIIYGFEVNNNVITNMLFSTQDGFSFYYDNNLKKGVVTQIDFDKWNLFNEPVFKETFDFHFFNTIYKEKFTVADDVVCINTSGTAYMKLSTKKAVLLANLKAETITIPKEFMDFEWTISTSHTTHTIDIKNYMCNANKPLIVFDGHFLAVQQNTIDLSDFGSAYDLRISKKRNAFLVTLTSTDRVKQLTIYFKDVFNQDMTETIVNTDAVLRRGPHNVLKVTDLLGLCKDLIDEEIFIPFVVL